MGSSPLLSLAILLTVLFVIVLPASSSASPNLGLRLQMNHVDAAGNFTRAQLLKRSKDRRLSRLTGHRGSGEYLLDLAIGTPPSPFRAILDTGSDLIWTQCKPCNECIPQPDPLFDPLNSSSYAILSCSHKLCHALPHYKCEASPMCRYVYAYGGGTVTEGIVGTETFTFGNDTKVQIPNLAFGCGLNDSGPLDNTSGLIGLARGPLSLISQLNVQKFSYCFVSYDEISSAPSPLFFGSLAKLKGGKVHSTPLLRNLVLPDATFYYLPLEGITVGKTLLQIPSSTFMLRKDGMGGTLIDSGTPSLVLAAVAYEEVSKAFMSQIRLPAINGTDMVGLELCFKTPQIPAAGTLPRLILHFHGADLDLPEKNYMEYDSEDGLLCLVIERSLDITIIGNYVTQNMHVLYDLKKEMLSVMPAKCSQL